MSLIELFCHVDDFCQEYEVRAAQQQLLRGRRRGPKPQLCASEIMTILIYFHISRYRDFKSYYTRHVQGHLRSEFPGLVSYNRFVELTPTVLTLLCSYLHTQFGQVTGLAFIDSTPLPVCHNRRIHRHQTFAALAGRGKTSMGWFYGFKLHLVVNECGELLGVRVTPGNVDDRKPVPQLTQGLFGKLFGDKGYLSQPLFDQLFARGVQLITPLRKNMKNRLMPLADRLLARKRALIETINDQLKNISQVAHTRHRSVDNFAVNLVAGLIAYTHQPKKPSLQLSQTDWADLPLLV